MRMTQGRYPGAGNPMWQAYVSVTIASFQPSAPCSKTSFPRLRSEVRTFNDASSSPPTLLLVFGQARKRLTSTAPRSSMHPSSPVASTSNSKTGASSNYASPPTACVCSTYVCGLLRLSSTPLPRSALPLLSTQRFYASQALAKGMCLFSHFNFFACGIASLGTSHLVDFWRRSGTRSLSPTYRPSRLMSSSHTRLNTATYATRFCKSATRRPPRLPLSKGLERPLISLRLPAARFALSIACFLTSSARSHGHLLNSCTDTSLASSAKPPACDGSLASRLTRKRTSRVASTSSSPPCGCYAPISRLISSARTALPRIGHTAGLLFSKHRASCTKSRSPMIRTRWAPLRTCGT